MAEISVRNLLIGFLAGAIATVTVHEIINFILNQTGFFDGRHPWQMTKAAVTGVPQIVSDMFWGGLWGSLFAAIHNSVPGDSLTLKGLIFGIVGPALIGVFILVPLLTGRIPLFLGFNPKALISVLLILSGFGAALGWLYGALGSRI